MADMAKTFLGGFLRASATTLATAYTNSVHQHQLIDQKYVIQDVSANSDDIARFPIYKRNDCLVLHGPLDASAFLTRTAKWHILLHQPGSQKIFSIYRSNDDNDAMHAFSLYQNVLPILAKIDPTICEKSTLEKFCAKLREPENTGWTPAHLAAALDIPRFIRDPSVKKFLNLQEGRNLETPLHVALRCKSSAAVTELMNMDVQMDITDLKGNTVLHYAAQSSPQILNLLISKLPERLAPLIDEVNRDGYTSLHLACKNNVPDNVKILLSAGADVKISSANEGYAIHIAVKKCCIVSIQELILHNSTQLNLKDSKDGGTPLHWASGPETLSVLLDLGCDPNMTNTAGETALHLAARRGCLKSAMKLLCHYAFPDMKDEAGDTPLHVASRLCSKVIIQLLIAFGADINLVNNRGESGRHLICTSQRDDKDHVLFYLDSVGANRCPKSLQAHCTEGCKHSEAFKGIPPENYLQTFQTSLVDEALYAFSAGRGMASRSRRGSLSDDMDVDTGTTSTGANLGGQLEAQIGGRVLCLDGGGIRGLVLTQTLLYMEKVFGVPIADLFDWVAGTSTGGILALCLASGKSVSEIQSLYLRFKDTVFTGERPYSAEVMEEFLKKELGCDTKMSNLRRPRVMITTAIVDHRPADFHFFRNYLSPATLLGESDSCNRTPEDVYVWEAAKYTGAAPSYFRLAGKYVDGGLVANNPTLDALTELTQFSAVMKATGQTREADFRLPSVVVSIGTGIQPRVKADVTHYDISRPNGIFDAISKVPKLASVIALLVEQTTQAEGQVVERARSWCSSIGVPYFRYSPSLSTFVDLDETNDEVLVNLMWETNAYLYAHHGSIQELKQLLFYNGSLPAGSV